MRKILIQTFTILIIVPTALLSTISVLKQIEKNDHNKITILKIEEKKNEFIFEKKSEAVVPQGKKKFNWASLSPKWSRSGLVQLRIRYVRNPRWIK